MVPQNPLTRMARLLGRNDRTSTTPAPPAIAFPDCRIVAMTWTIPEDFGGLTSVLLRRSTMISELGARDVPILTFSSSLDVKSKTNELRAMGKLGARVHLRNCWAEIATMRRSQLRAFAHAAEPAPEQVPHEMELAVGSDDDHVRTMVSADGSVRITEHKRPNGSVVVRDERKLKSGRGLVLLDHRGRELGHWPRARDLYFAWVDHVVGSDPTIILNDSKYVGSFLHHYRRPNVRTAQVFHNPHLKENATSPYGPFTVSRAPILFEHEQFDGLAFLTERQKDDFSAVFPRRGHTFVVPNSREIAQELPDVESPRDPGGGIMLARLSTQKQVDHTIRAFALLEQHTPELAARVDVYGSGPLEEELAALIDEEGASGRITLRGYDPAASDRLTTASFLVLSSRYEGLPLVLVEAMAAGCIPIAYDIRYGPGDVISDGVDGFVVPAGDPEALADAIRRFVTMSESERVAMRRAAQQKARRFDDLSVTRMWADAFTTLMEPQPDPPQLGSAAEVSRAAFVSGSEPGLELQGTATGAWSTEPGAVRLRVASRDKKYGFEMPVDTRPDSDSMSFSVLVPEERLDPDARCTYDFWLTTAGSSQKKRLAVDAGALDPATERGVRGRARIYATVHGNLSIEVDATS